MEDNKKLDTYDSLLSDKSKQELSKNINQFIDKIKGKTIPFKYEIKGEDPEKGITWILYQYHHSRTESYKNASSLLKESKIYFESLYNNLSFPDILISNVVVFGHIILENTDEHFIIEIDKKPMKNIFIIKVLPMNKEDFKKIVLEKGEETISYFFNEVSKIK